MNDLTVMSPDTIKYSSAAGDNKKTGTGKKTPVSTSTTTAPPASTTVNVSAPTAPAMPASHSMMSSVPNWAWALIGAAAGGIAVYFVTKK